ncbi:MAG TPA: MFS transporter [Burkholderiaceae bacterium]|nr:MFS transporter [Burkholderiaceae bacterium]
MARQPAVAFVLVTVVIDVIGIGLIIPVLPVLVGEFTGGREAQTYWYGLLVLAFGISQFACAPLLGALSDRFGRRPVLLSSMAGMGLMFFLTAQVTTLVGLLATRVIGGALSANMAVANAYVADLTAHESRAKSLGLVGAAFGIGFILGPVVGGLLGHYDIRLPFFVAAGLCVLNFLYGAVVVPESLPPDKRKTISPGRVNPLAALFGLARLRNVGLLVAVIALNNLAQFILHVTWVLYTEFRFGWGPRETGLSLFVVGIAATLVQGVLLGTMLRRLGEHRTVLCGLVSGVLAYAGYGLATQGWMMYAIIFANFLSYAVGPAMVAIVSKAADPREQGLVMGTLASLSSLMVVVAPLIGTPLLAEVSQLPATDWRVGLPYLLSSALNLAALAMAALYFARHRQMRPSTLGAVR